MSIVYKIARNVRFVLFRKNSNAFPAVKTEYVFDSDKILHAAEVQMWLIKILRLLDTVD